MSNYVITRPSYCGYVSTASGYAIATSASAMASPVSSLGSVREVVFEVNSDVVEATSTSYNDAVVATAISGYKGTVTIQCEEITSSALMLAFGLTGSALLLSTDASATTPTNYSIVTHPWYIDGSASTLILTKCQIVPNSSRKIGKEQEILELKFNVLVDTDASAGKKFCRYLQA